MRTREERLKEMEAILDELPEPHEDVVGAVVVFFYEDGEALAKGTHVDDPAVADTVNRTLHLVRSAGVPEPGRH